MDPQLPYKPLTGDECPYCKGSGLKSWGKLGFRKCVKCKGTGRLPRDLIVIAPISVPIIDLRKQ